MSASRRSEGFENFNEVLSKCAKKVKVAESEWSCFMARDIVCVKSIKENLRLLIVVA